MEERPRAGGERAHTGGGGSEPGRPIGPALPPARPFHLTKVGCLATQQGCPGSGRPTGRESSAPPTGARIGRPHAEPVPPCSEHLGAPFPRAVSHAPLPSAGSVRMPSLAAAGLIGLVGLLEHRPRQLAPRIEHAAAGRPAGGGGPVLVPAADREWPDDGRTGHQVQQLAELKRRGRRRRPRARGLGGSRRLLTDDNLVVQRRRDELRDARPRQPAARLGRLRIPQRAQLRRRVIAHRPPVAARATDRHLGT
eukprot:scaffold5135_cov113-Isochrysis_galbana.AAC.8